MKYRQIQRKNQRLQQINDTTLIVGLDAAKSIHVARAIDIRGVELGMRCTLKNNKPGFKILVEWIQKLQRTHDKTNVILGIEPTGHYWFPLAQYLEEQNIRLVLVNPSHVKKTKELDDNSPTKNDTKDAKVIAELVKNGKYTEPRLPKKVYADLRILMNQRERCIDSLGQIKNQVHQWLGRFFPEYTEVFKSWEGKASLIILREFPLPHLIVEQGVQPIVARWRREIIRGIGIKRATQLFHQALESVGLREGCTSARLELSILLEQYDLLMRQQEALIENVEQLLKQIPYAEFLLTVPGVGIITVAGFLAETGDLNLYEDGQQIIRLAGFNLMENSSGQHHGKTKIAKRGRSRLRALLFRSVLALVRINPDFRALHQYYTTRSQNPLKKKQSIVALCGKLVRVFYTLGTRQLIYDSHFLIGPVRQEQLRKIA